MQTRRVSNVSVDESNFNFILLSHWEFGNLQMNFMLSKEAFLIGSVDLEMGHLLSMEVKEEIFSSFFDGQSDNEVAFVSFFFMQEQSKVVCHSFNTFISKLRLLVAKMVSIRIVKVRIKHSVWFWLNFHNTRFGLKL